jgi:hypothetical protein
MFPSRRSILLAASIILVGTTQTVGREVCRPQLSFQQARFSDVQNLQRKWTAVLAVDASHCAVTSGRFDLKFIRLKETAPDLEFSEQFTWRSGEVEVSADFWQDEAVLKYSIGFIAPCVCRD